MLFKDCLLEIKKSSKKEYETLTKDYYKDKKFLDLVLQGDDTAKFLTKNNDIKTEKTDSGNIIIRYVEGNNNVVILGMISKKGKMERDDIKDLKEWMGRLKEKMKDGYDVYSSFNELSRPLFDRIKEELKEDGYKVTEKEISPEIKFKDNKWNTFLIKTEKA